MSAPEAGHVFLATGDGFAYGVRFPRENGDEAIAAFLWEMGIDAAQVNDAEKARIEGCMTFLPMRSVVRSDTDYGDVDDVDPGEYHTEGTGKRVIPCWWVERGVWQTIVDDIEDRLIAKCSHEHMHELGYCLNCRADKRRIAQVAGEVAS